MAIPLRSGREHDDSKEVKQQIEVENEKEKASSEINEEEMRWITKKINKSEMRLFLEESLFPTILPFTLHPYPSLKDLEKPSSMNNFPNFLTSSRNWK